MKSVVVTIPVYKSVPSASEVVSLRRAATVLARYPIVLFCPNDLDVSAYLALCPVAQVVRFEMVFLEKTTPQHTDTRVQSPHGCSPNH